MIEEPKVSRTIAGDRSSRPTFRQLVRFYLDDIETPLGRAIDLSITALVLLSAAIFVAQTYALPEWRWELERLDQVIVSLFAIEYLLRFWGAENRLRYCLSRYALIDLLAILPFFIGLFNISFIRVLRWFRILRLVRFLQGRTLFGYVAREDTVILARIILTLFIIIFIFSGLIYQVEHPSNSRQFATFLDAVYFSVATMTTVGFGDVTPASETGRLLTILMILTGIALIPTQVGALIQYLIRPVDRGEQAVTCRGCGLACHAADALFCKHCGTALAATKPVHPDETA